MKVKATLELGDILAVYRDKTDWTDFGCAVYCWEDGNFSCDCNRMMFLFGTEFREPEYKCGDKVKLISLDIDNDT